MGMDIYGRRPSSAAGEYYRGQWTDWHPLADCICALAPIEASACEGWHSNDGDGLDAQGSVALAEKIDSSILDGTADRYINEFHAELQKPRKLCILCAGDIVQETKDTEEPKLAAGGGRESGMCDNCGKRDQVKTSYKTDTSLHINDLKYFSEFSRHSGGFSIW